MLSGSCDDGNFKAKLADFGLAEWLSSNYSKPQSYNKQVGTRGYTAPEIVANQPYGSPSDIWSLGCLIHVMLTVTLPYHADRNGVKLDGQKYFEES